jgi:hypothetical protein
MSLLRHGPARTELACPRIPLPHGRPDSQAEGEDRHDHEADDKKPFAAATYLRFAPLGSHFLVSHLSTIRFPSAVPRSLLPAPR